MTPPARSQAGSATVWVLSLVLVLSVVAGAAMVLVQLRVARAAVAGAADLAALAAAAQLPDVRTGCDRAAEVASAVGAELVGCTSDGTAVDVVVARTLHEPWSGLGPVTVRSRAGPPGAR